MFLALAALASAMAVGCDGLFYYPDRTVHASAEGLGFAAHDDLEFASADGTSLHGWWIPAVGDTALGTIVFCHGNHANLTHHARGVQWLPRRGFNLLIFDYRGFGRSGGDIDRAGTVDDAVAAIDMALRRDPERTIVFGHSLGGAIGMVAAARRPQVRAVIAESTFPSYRAAARATAPRGLGWIAPLVIRTGQDPVDFLQQLSPRPLLVIHGTDDAITPFHLGESLFASAHEPKSFLPIEGGGHATPWFEQGTEFEDAVVGFLLDALR